MLKVMLFGALACCAVVDAHRHRHPAYRRRIAPEEQAEMLAYASAVDHENVDSFYPPQPYRFGFHTVDEYGTRMTRHEESDAHNRKKGSYSFTDANGISRRVDYVADEHGFRAMVKTNEPGTASSQPASATVINAPTQRALEIASSYIAPVHESAPVVIRMPYYHHQHHETNSDSYLHD